MAMATAASVGGAQEEREVELPERDDEGKERSGRDAGLMLGW